MSLDSPDINKDQRRATEIPSPMALYDWWIDAAKDEAEQTIKKMLEYGSGDLVAVGRQVISLAGRPPVSDSVAMETGCLFYLIGKMERAISAHRRGSTPSDDTWFDIAVYSKMVLAKRNGIWTT